MMKPIHDELQTARTEKGTPTGEWGFVEGDELVQGCCCLGLLGGGSRYEVYLAFEERRHAVVVVKMLRPARVSDPEAVDGLRGEVRALAQLSHPVLIRSFGAELEGPRPHLILEHVEGPRLSTTLRRFGRAAIEQTLPLGLQLASALHYMAEEGFVHLDVKPSNIIMAGPPRLIDLSITRTPAQAWLASGPLGTDAYMAPEQCLPERFGTIGPPTDVWGLGATMYEALMGSQPFRTTTGDPCDTPGDRYPQLQGTLGPFARDIPSPLVELVTGCLCDDPAERPTAREVARALEPVVAAMPRRVGLGRLIPRH